MQGAVVDHAPSVSHLCGFRHPVPSQNLLKTIVGNGEGECSGLRSSTSADQSVSHVGSYHCGYKRGGLIEDAEQLSCPKKRKVSASDTGALSSCSSDLCTESNGCLVYVYGKDSSDRESVYSVQSKVTEIVKDSSDDLWFLEEDANSDRYSVDVYADEYEVVSERYSESDSDMDDIISSREDVIVICEESDLEFFADCEWSNVDDDSSDDELLHGDKWFCLTCQHMNSPLHRFCESCWTLRPDWLPKSSPKTPPEHGESSKSNDSAALHTTEGDERLFAGGTQDNNKLNVQSSSSDSQCKVFVDGELDRSEASVEGRSIALLECTDASGIVHPALQSSQDSGFGSIPLGVLSSSQLLSVTPSSSDVSLACLDKSRDCAGVTNSTPDGEMQSPPGPPCITTSCSVPPGSCIICLSQPKEATIIHGKTGHQSCCYRCACRLRRHRKPCPVCRQPIQKVVRNYFVEVP